MMARNARYAVKFRRRCEGRTDYRYRLRLLKSRKTRMIVRKTSTNIIIQFAEYDANGDRILVMANGAELQKFGWSGSHNNIPAAYLTGLLAGQRAKKHKIKEAVLDIGLHAPISGAGVFATLKGAVDAGIMIPHSPDILPAEVRVRGEHIIHINPGITKMFETTRASITKAKSSSKGK